MSKFGASSKSIVSAVGTRFPRSRRFIQTRRSVDGVARTNRQQSVRTSDNPRQSVGKLSGGEMVK